METLGSVAKGILAAKDEASRASRSQNLAKLARRQADGLPVLTDQETDVEIPRRLICFRPSSSPVEIRRAMTASERAAIEARAAALELALRPYDDDFDRLGLEAVVGAMLSGFRSMRQEGEDAEATVTITLAVLREFPAWAIQRACITLSRGEMRSEVRFAPNDAEIADSCRRLVSIYHSALENAQSLLAAVPAEPVAPKPSPAEIEATLGRKTGDRAKPDGGHAARVAADLARRKAQRESAELP